MTTKNLCFRTVTTSKRRLTTFYSIPRRQREAAGTFLLFLHRASVIPPSEGVDIHFSKSQSVHRACVIPPSEGGGRRRRPGDVLHNTRKPPKTGNTYVQNR